MCLLNNLLMKNLSSKRISKMLVKYILLLKILQWKNNKLVLWNRGSSNFNNKIKICSRDLCIIKIAIEINLPFVILI